MSENVGYDPNWWREAAAMSIARRAAKAASAAAIKPGDSFLIVTEGTVTEPVYFELLCTGLQLSTVRVKVQPGDHSDPRYVIRSAEREAKEQVRKARRGELGIDEPPKFDHVWAVIDTDVAASNGIWNDVKQLASARKVMLAHSTPCFEFWLLLHFGLTTRGDLVNGDAAKSAVSQMLDCEYSTNAKTAREAMATFICEWPKAVIHADRVRKHHLEGGTPSPANPSTEVDRLVRGLNDSALAHMRSL